MAQEQKAQESEENFYEAVGAVTNRYRYSKPNDNYHEYDYDPGIKREARITGIITVILVLMVALGLSLFLMNGLQTIKDNYGPSPATQSSTH
jgi:hypothetical protein